MARICLKRARVHPRLFLTESLEKPTKSIWEETIIDRFGQGVAIPRKPLNLEFSKSRLKSGRFSRTGKTGKFRSDFFDDFLELSKRP